MDAAVEPAKADVLAPLFADFDADFPVWPEAGQPTKIVLDGRRFPAGSQVTISTAVQGAGGRGVGAPGSGYGFGGRGGGPPAVGRGGFGGRRAPGRCRPRRCPPPSG